MLAVAVLVAHHRLDAALIQQALHREAFARVEGHRLFEGDETGPAFDAHTDELGPQMGHGAEAEDVRPHGGGHFRRIRAGAHPAQFGGSRLQAGRVDIADARHLEPRVGLEGEGMVHAALAHARYDDLVFPGHATLPSHSSTLPTV